MVIVVDVDEFVFVEGDGYVEGSQAQHDVLDYTHSDVVGLVHLSNAAFFCSGDSGRAFIAETHV